MPTFKYVGPEGPWYTTLPRPLEAGEDGPRLGLAPVPGKTYELDEDPGDGRWQPEPATPAGKAKAAKEN